MARFIVAVLFVALNAATAFQAQAEEMVPHDSTEVSGQVIILKEVMIKPVGPIDAGSLIIADIPDSGSRPPQKIKVDGGASIPLGHVRGVATNKAGQSLMGGGYTWYLFKAPSGVHDVHVRVSYLANGGKMVARDHQVLIQPRRGEATSQAIRSSPTQSAWSPPTDANPQTILNEAQSDMAAGRYPEALAKHVWFYTNAIKINPAYAGVRLSFALAYWKQLGMVYPPALDKLKELRDEARQKVLAGGDVFESFGDFVALNSVLGDEEKTVELFKKFDAHDAKMAKKVFELARPALIKAGDTKLCSKYVDPKFDYPRYVDQYHQLVTISHDSPYGEKQIEFAHQSFSNEVATLVALLVVGDHKAEGEKIAADAKTVWNDARFAKELDKALKGQVPEPWPPSVN